MLKMILMMMLTGMIPTGIIVAVFETAAARLLWDTGLAHRS